MGCYNLVTYKKNPCWDLEMSSGQGARGGGGFDCRANYMENINFL